MSNIYYCEICEGHKDDIEDLLCALKDTLVTLLKHANSQEKYKDIVNMFHKNERVFNYMVEKEICEIDVNGVVKYIINALACGGEEDVIYLETLRIILNGFNIDRDNLYDDIKSCNHIYNEKIKEKILMVIKK